MKLMYTVSIVVAVAAIYLYYTRDTFDPESLKGKNVLVTGSSQNIGKAIALQYARFGANVFITARNEDKLKQVLEQLQKVGRKGAKFSYYVADMAKFETEANVLVQKAVETLGSLDQVILNHAMIPTPSGGIWNGTGDELPTLTKMMDVNFHSFAYLTAAVLPHLEKTRGQLGVVSSISGKIESFGIAPYCASKFAMDGFFSTLRMEGLIYKRPVSITVHNLGVIATEDPFLEKFTKAYNIKPEKFKDIWSGAADVTDTAEAVIRATTRGDAELYYPPIQTVPLSWLPWLRIVLPLDKVYDIKAWQKDGH